MTNTLTPQSTKPNLIGMTRDQLAEVMLAIGEKPFRARQLWNWLYIRGVKTFADMTNLSKVMRERLEASYGLSRPEIVEHLVSTDGTQKWLFRLHDGNEIEAVFIPEDDRGAMPDDVVRREPGVFDGHPRSRQRARASVSATR